MSKVPEYLESTITMIKGVFPSDIPDNDYFPLIRVLKDSDMSDRSVAEVVATLLGGTYVEYMYDVAHISPNMIIDEDTLLDLVNRLKDFGYASWLEED